MWEAVQRNRLERRERIAISRPSTSDGGQASSLSVHHVQEKRMVGSYTLRHSARAFPFIFAKVELICHGSFLAAITFIGSNLTELSVRHVF